MNPDYHFLFLLDAYLYIYNWTWLFKALSTYSNYKGLNQDVGLLILIQSSALIFFAEKNNVRIFCTAKVSHIFWQKMAVFLGTIHLKFLTTHKLTTFIVLNNWVLIVSYNKLVYQSYTHSLLSGLWPGKPEPNQ